MSEEQVGRNSPCPCRSGKKFKHCCYRKDFAGQVEVPAKYHDGASDPYPHQMLRLVTETVKERVLVNYNFHDEFGLGEVSYEFDRRQYFLCVDKHILRAEQVSVGVKFNLEDGTVATVTAVSHTKSHSRPPANMDRHGNTLSNVRGTVKYTGHYPVLELSVAEQTFRTTPGHPFFSISRGGWVDAGSLRVGELLQDKLGQPTPVTYLSEVSFQYVELFNIEVEETHTYFVGVGDESVWTHNGLGGVGCGIPKPAIVEDLIGVTPRQLELLGRGARRLVSEAGLPVGDLVVQGSRVAGKPRETARFVFDRDTGARRLLGISDIDVALRVDHKIFFDLAETALSRARPGTRLRDSMLQRIQGNGQLSSFDLGSAFQQLRIHHLAPTIEHLPIQFSVIKIAGKFDTGPFISLKGGG